jgi:mitochondrial fission protein ELM1
LAEALQLPFEIKRLEYNSLHVLGPRLLGRSLASLTKASREEVLAEAPPDITISAGHRSVPVVQAVRYKSNGRTRSIHVGFPRVSPHRFDLVITTPQYPVPNRPNVLGVPYALTRAAVAAPDATDRVRLAMLAEPRQLLLVGGPNLYWTIDDKALLATLASILDEASRNGGSVLATTSARTPAYVRDAIRQMLSDSAVPTLLTEPGKPPGYHSLLDAADSIRITADSVAMVSDAIWTGKRVALIPVAKSALGKLAMGVMDRLRPGRRVYPQDLRHFWTALAEIGVTERLGTPRTSPQEEAQRVITRVRATLSRSV